jgi:sulfonate transport system substrate-binding protein
VIWDPYLAAAERATGARVLADGQEIAPNREFYLSRRAFTESSPEIVSAVIAAIGSIDAWAEGHADTVAAELAPAIGVPAPVLQVALERQSYGAAPLDATAIADQQRVADAFHTLGLLPKPIRVADAVWTQPERRAESR